MEERIEEKFNAIINDAVTKTGISIIYVNAKVVIN